jgi:hypothetical protein
VPPTSVTSPPKICPTARPRLAARVPGSSTSAASSSCCPALAKGMNSHASREPAEEASLDLHILITARR